MSVRRSTATGKEVEPASLVISMSWGRMYAIASAPSGISCAPATMEWPKCTCRSQTVPRRTFEAPTNAATNGVAGWL